MKKYCYLILYVVLSYVPCKLSAQSALEFIENKGQWGIDWFRYRVNTIGGEVLLENNGFRYVLADDSNNWKIDAYHHGQITKKPIVKFHVYTMTFQDALQPVILGERPQKTYYNYYLGNDKSRWKANIHPYRDVDYTRLYNGIDMHVSSEKGNMVYEFIVHPQADASQIKIKIDGPDDVHVNRDGNLVITTSVGQVMEMKPFVYQYIHDNRVTVTCNYKLKNNILTYSFPDGYDHSQTLVIDPTVVFCSFTGSTADNWGFTATYDNSGNFYLGGLVNADVFGGSYPVSPGAFQTTYGGGEGDNSVEYGADIGIMKLTSDGSSRVFATYIGGANNERPHSMIVDAHDNLVIAGRTHSRDFPVTTGAYDVTANGGWDMFVTKLKNDGTALVGSTYIGGTDDDGVNFDSTEIGYGELKLNYGDDARSEVQVDKAGNIYVAGCTNSTNFPTTSTAIATTLSGMQDGVIFKLDSNLTSLIWSTYISGNGSDAGYVIAFDTSQNNIYVAGGTNSSNLPVPSSGAWHSSYLGGGADGFVLKFKNSTPYNVVAGSYVGMSGYDQVYGIQVDNANNVYVMGQSEGGLFPVTPGVYSDTFSTQFVMKMDSSLSTDLVSTVYGSGVKDSFNISPVAFLVDTCGNVYISGWGGNLFAPPFASSLTGTCYGMPITPDAYQSTTDGRDFYFIVFGADLATLRYATYYGRYSDNPGLGEHVDGGTSRFDKHGIIYQAICANCGGTFGPPFPTTTGAWATVDGSANCNEAGLKIAFNIGPVIVNISVSPSTSGCAPLTVDFTNLTVNGLSYVWNFGDGSALDTSFNATHTFTAPGVYTVSLAAANSNACFKTNDTGHVIITVDSNNITPAFTTNLIDSCGPYIAAFTNTSLGSSASTYTWYFGDSGTYAGFDPTNHTYLDTGVYIVTLVMADSTACKSPDTVSHPIHFSSEKVAANFFAPDTVCARATFNLYDSSLNATGHVWYFGNGDSSSSATTYKYDSGGIYTIRLIALNSSACGGSDTFTRTIVVLNPPIALFSFTPTIAVPNDSVHFTNSSLFATSYKWDFGDGATSTEINPIHFYRKTGNYTVCLNAYNSSGCPSQLCKQVPSDIEPIADIPTGFTPNGDGENDILYVRGAAIASIDLRIYNRWGEMVFESTEQSHGWDGTYKGEPQPMDAYAYVLNVWFIDGTTKQKKGNVTLLR